MSWKPPISWRGLAVLFGIYVVAEIFTPLPKFVRQLVSDHFQDKGYTIAYAANECAPLTRLWVGLHRFHGYFAGLPRDADLVSFLEENRADLERVVQLYYDGVSIGYSRERFSEASADEYFSLLRKLCVRVQVVAFDPKPVRRMPDGKPGPYSAVLGFKGNIFDVQERIGANMLMGKTLVYWPPGEFSHRYRSCSHAGLDGFSPKIYEERTIDSDRCCNISGTWNMCVTTIFK